MNGIGVFSWNDAPTDIAAWPDLATLQTEDFTEPPLASAPGKPAASGGVILEGDGRGWLVSPSNAFGDYVNTFPKGKREPGLSMRVNALKECFEEAGLQVVLTGFLCDSVRSTSVTRCYTARRVGGHPADMDAGVKLRGVPCCQRDFGTNRSEWRTASSRSIPLAWPSIGAMCVECVGVKGRAASTLSDRFPFRLGDPSRI